MEPFPKLDNSFFLHDRKPERHKNNLINKQQFETIDLIK